MRHPGRLITRPVPQEQIELALDIGVAVDAWWSDGWWEGVVTGLDDSGNEDVHIYFPGNLIEKQKNNYFLLSILNIISIYLVVFLCNAILLLLIGEGLFLNIHRTNLRKSRDWFGGRWIDVEAKPSILSTISDLNSADDKHSKFVSHVEPNSSANVNAGTNLSQVKEEILEETALASLEMLRELNGGMKQVSSELDDQSEDDGVEVDTKNSSHNLKDSNGGGDNTTNSDSEDENDENSNWVNKSEMDSMETSEQNCREEEAEDMDMDTEAVDV